MKTNILILAGLMALGAAALRAQEGEFRTADLTTEVSSFHDDLQPYGEWVSVNETVVWRPTRVRDGWRPYMLGRWVWTDAGWYWVSTEPFGWAVFHYGRWVFDDYYGWIWIPDRVWSPAWVEWRYSDEYVGWAPLSPYGLRVSFAAHFGPYWSNPWHHWNFIRCGDFGTTYRYREYVPPTYVRRIIGNTRRGEAFQNDNGRIINRGVDRNFIESRTRSRVEVADVRQSTERRESLTRDGGRSRIEIYRPNFEERASPRQDIRRGDRGFSWENGHTPVDDNGRTRGGSSPQILIPDEHRFRDNTVERNDQRQNPPRQQIQNPAPQRRQPEYRGRNSNSAPPAVRQQPRTSAPSPGSRPSSGREGERRRR